MCQKSVIDFIAKAITTADLTDKSILEIGSYDRNGSARKLFADAGAGKFWGVDLEMGPSVDEVVRAENVVEHFGEAAFDVVMSTEVIEHTEHWRTVINNMKGVLKPGGYLFLTTRSKGFNFHGFPDDYWRYEVSDMKKIFADFEVLLLESDPGPDGVFVLARKPQEAAEKTPLEAIELYSIITGRRQKELSKGDKIKWTFEWFVRRVMGRLFPSRKEHWTVVC